MGSARTRLPRLEREGRGLTEVPHTIEAGLAARPELVSAP